MLWLQSGGWQALVPEEPTFTPSLKAGKGWRLGAGSQARGATSYSVLLSESSLQLIG